MHILLGNTFSRLRWYNEFSAFKLPRKDNSDKAQMSLDVKTIWSFGNMGGISNISLDRLQTSVTVSCFPKFLEKIGVLSVVMHVVGCFLQCKYLNNFVYLCY